MMVWKNCPENREWHKAPRHPYTPCFTCEAHFKDVKQAIVAFVARVNARAEDDMLKGGSITGAHHRALEAELKGITK